MNRFLTLFAAVSISLTACSGGGGTTVPLASTGASGEICVTSSDKYTIKDGLTGESKEVTIEPEPFLEHFMGNIGGQIRAVSSSLVSMEDAEPLTLAIWGQGPSIQYGTAGVTLGPLLLKNEGAVTDMISYGSSAAPKIFYGSTRGIGIIDIKEDGKFGELAYRPVPAGVLSVAASKQDDKTRFFFVTGDGYVLSVGEEELSAGAGCYDILSSSAVLKDGEVNYTPAKVAVASTKAMVLAKKNTAGGFTPTFAETFDPVLEELAGGPSAAIVRAVDIGSHGVENVAFVSDTGLTGFDKFIPSDVASDGTNFYVAGLAYEKAAVDGFVVTSCSEPTTAEKINCMREEAKGGDLTSLDTSLGVDALTGGFFIYRDPATIGAKAAHFARAAITTYAKSEDAPPLIFHAAVVNDKASFRAPNFLAVMTKTADSSGKEKWETGPAYDVRNGLIAGVPANLSVISSAGDSFIAATFVAVKGADGSGASSLEIVRSDGTLLTETGSIKTRLEDGRGGYLAAIDTTSERGGVPYLENAVERNRIDFTSTMTDAYAARAAYDGDNYAFAWSNPGGPWRIEWQRRLDSLTRGQLSFNRTGDANHFKNFPDVGGGDTKALEDARDVADMAFAEGKLFVLLYGFAGGKHYYQGVVYGATVSDEKYHPALQGFTNMISLEGDEFDRRARFQKITKSPSGIYTAVFSCAGGLKQFQTPLASPPAPVNITSLFSARNVMDLDLDDAGTRFAFIQNKTIKIRNFLAPVTDISSTSLPSSEGTTSRLSNSSIVLLQDKLFVSTPVGTAAPFWIINVAAPAAPAIFSKCKSCSFNGLASFPSFAGQILASSDTGGVEIYKVSDL